MKLFILDKLLICSIFFLFAISSKGQSYTPDYTTQRSFACIIIDAHTATPLENATLRVGRYGRSADEAGRVEALANIGDTLVFTHVGYFPAILEVKDSLFAQNMVAVALSPDTIMLSEVLVKPRRLTLSQEAKQMTTIEHKQNTYANQVFAASTYQALTAPTTNREWNAEDNQRNTIGRHTMRVEYKGMIAPDQMVCISSNIIIGAIISIVKKIADRPRLTAVKPLSADELSTLLRYEESEKEEEP